MSQLAHMKGMDDTKTTTDICCIKILITKQKAARPFNYVNEVGVCIARHHKITFIIDEHIRETFLFKMN